MSKELVIGSNRHETKVAILEEDQLVEVYFQRANEYSLAGSIHKGRVTRVLPGMQSAFVDLGLERDTFLYVSDFFEEHDDIDTLPEDRPAGIAEARPAIRTEERSSGRGDERPGGRGENRRDRGNRGPDRSLDRAQDRPPAITRPLEARTVEPRTVFTQPVPAAPDTEEPEDETPITAAAAVPESRPAGEHARPQDAGEGRGGDRRGRRSRRRRRGRDFPDNKYAQPNAAPPISSEMPRQALEMPRQAIVQPPGGEQGPASDVIILPGESLAKYRQKPADEFARPLRHAVPETETQSGGFLQAAENQAEEHEPEPDTATREELEAEAEELELSDKIFGHYDGPPEAEEEKIAEVVQDHPAPNAEPEDDASTAEALANVVSIRSEISEAALLAPEISAPLRYSTGAEAEEALEAHAPASHLPHPLSAVEDGDDFEGSLAEEELPDIDDLSSEIEEALEMEAAGSAAAGEEAGGPPAAQSATLREQGGRSMHRVSRRTRRRRGGNRFGQGEQASSAAAGGSSGAGAALALDPAKADVRREVVEEHAAERPERVMPSISELLKAGQEIIVQIAKEPLGLKGARITSHIALPGRYVVFMPSVAHLGVSRKVSSEEERQRLKRILQTHRVGTTGGFIVRTAGEGVPEEEIAADMNFLYTLWLDIRQKAEKKPAPVLLHYDLDIVQRILRDQVTEDFKAVWVDNEDLYESVLTFMQRFQPSLVNRVKMYTRSAPIFDAFNITQELEKALRPKVWLKSGGYIVINQTEALVAIDINTGKYVGKSNRLEDTIVKTNIEAVKEIVRQIRLRDLGGIIVVDFIDMDERKNRQRVMQALEEAMESDKAPNKILQFNDFGLVAITRKRVKQSLERTLCSPCPHCEGAGYVKSVQTVIGEVLVEAQKIAKAIEGSDVLLRVHPDVAKVLKASDNKYLEELEEILGRPVLVKSDPALHHEKFDLG